MSRSGGETSNDSAFTTTAGRCGGSAGPFCANSGSAKRSAAVTCMVFILASVNDPDRVVVRRADGQAAVCVSVFRPERHGACGEEHRRRWIVRTGRILIGPVIHAHGRAG